MTDEKKRETIRNWQYNCQCGQKIKASSREGRDRAVEVHRETCPRAQGKSRTTEPAG